jgi:hypothetical protein
LWREGGEAEFGDASTITSIGVNFCVVRKKCHNGSKNWFQVIPSDQFNMFSHLTLCIEWREQ